MIIHHQRPFQPQHHTPHTRTTRLLSCPSFFSLWLCVMCIEGSSLWRTRHNTHEPRRASHTHTHTNFTIYIHILRRNREVSQTGTQRTLHIHNTTKHHKMHAQTYKYQHSNGVRENTPKHADHKLDGWGGVKGVEGARRTREECTDTHAAPQKKAARVGTENGKVRPFASTVNRRLNDTSTADRDYNEHTRQYTPHHTLRILCGDLKSTI